MAEYIEREAALNVINENKSSTELAWISVSKIPAADVAPVVHGQWVNGCQCSVCGDRHGPYNSRHRPYYNYCPNCGAKMDEEVNTHDD